MLQPTTPRWPVRILAAVLILIASAVHCHAQLIIDADSQHRFAQSRFDAGAFDEAIVEFNRFIHFFPSDPRILQARFQTGMANFYAGRYPAAAAIFNALTGEPAPGTVASDAFFMLSRSHARQGMLDQAMIDLHNLMALLPEADIMDRARYELGWLHVDRGQWRLADDAFSRITPANQARFQIGGLKQALSDSDAIPSKSPLTAGLLSIVPGGGQLYLKRYQDALTALLINTGLAWAAWESFDNDLNALGGIIAFVGLGFYTGNIYGAVAGAHKFNQDRNREFKEHLNQRRQLSWSLAPTPAGAVALFLTINF